MAKKKFYYKKQEKQTNKNFYDPKMEIEGRKIPISELVLSDKTKKLLIDNNFKTAADLVVRTEKDMYRIQTFGKKHFIELSNVLKKKGLCFASTEKSEKEAPVVKVEQPKKVEKAEHLPNRKFFTLSGKLRQGEGRPKYETEVVKQLSPPYPPSEWRKVQRGTKWGFYDGVKNIIPPVYDEIFTFKEGLACAELDEKCGFINTDNKVIIPFEYESALSFSEGYAMVVKNGKCGYIDKTNKLIIDFQFDAATPFEGGNAKVKKDGKWGQLEKNGTVKWNAK